MQFTDSTGAPLASNLTSATISMKRHDFPFGGSFDVSQVSSRITRVRACCSCTPHCNLPAVVPASLTAYTHMVHMTNEFQECLRWCVYMSNVSEHRIKLVLQEMEGRKFEMASAGHVESKKQGFLLLSCRYSRLGRCRGVALLAQNHLMNPGVM